MARRPGAAARVGAVVATLLATLAGACADPGPGAATAPATVPSGAAGAGPSSDGIAVPSAAASATASATARGADGGGAVSPGAAASPAATPATPAFASSVEAIGPELAARMATSWRPGCPVPLEDLRYVTVSHVDFGGVVRTGELVVHADVADAVVGVFARLFEIRFAVRQMRLVDDFGGDDTASMEADNTSAFNCRAVTGGTRWSEHAYGRAIDLNPVENPYVLGSHVAPEAGRAFLGREAAPGVVRAGDAVVQAFADAGWLWGGDWQRPVDYQHFSVTGR